MTDLLRLDGRLRLRAKERRAWLRAAPSVCTIERYERAGFGGYEPANVPGFATVQDVLDGLMRDRHLDVRATYARNPILVSGIVPDDRVGAYWPLLVGAFEQAAPSGGKGELTLTYERADTMRVQLDGEGGVSLSCVDLRREAAAAAGPVRVPGVIEPARSGRASCVACRARIDEGALRFGAQDVARSLPGRPSYRWYHLPCAAQALPHSLAPVLREATIDIPDRDAIWASLPEDARQAEAPRVFERGDRVSLEDGRQGTVVWFGKGRYGGGLRVGVELDGEGEAIWVAADDVTPLA